jgi:hypothetical protein
MASDRESTELSLSPQARLPRFDYGENLCNPARS